MIQRMVTPKSFNSSRRAVTPFRLPAAEKSRGKISYNTPSRNQVGGVRAANCDGFWADAEKCQSNAASATRPLMFIQENFKRFDSCCAFVRDCFQRRYRIGAIPTTA